MSEYTQGPWQAEKRNWKGEPSGHKVYISGDVREDWGSHEDDEDAEKTTVATAVAIVEGNATSGGVTEANARLIAAAPCLLEALKFLVEGVEMDILLFPGQLEKESRLGKAHEAIARATS